MPCSGCYGPPEGVVDSGAKMVAALGSVLDLGDYQGLTEEQVAEKADAILAGIPDPAGTFYKYSLAGSLLRRESAMKRISINPITRLEGHGKIEIFLDEEGNVANTYFQVPELRGFEQFCVGRRAEEMPVITNRICGVCPEAHHMASVKALDRLFGVEPPPAAKKIRELLYMAFFVTDHTTHFYALGGPDFIVGPDAPPAERNILGRDPQSGSRRRQTGDRMPGQKSSRHPDAGRTADPPGRRPAGRLEQARHGRGAAEIEEAARQNIEFALFSLGLFDTHRLGNPAYRGNGAVATSTITAPTTWGRWTSATASTCSTARSASWIPEGGEFVKYRRRRSTWRTSPSASNPGPI